MECNCQLQHVAALVITICVADVRGCRVDEADNSSSISWGDTTWAKDQGTPEFFPGLQMKGVFMSKTKFC